MKIKGICNDCDKGSFAIVVGKHLCLLLVTISCCFGGMYLKLYQIVELDIT